MRHALRSEGKGKGNKAEAGSGTCLPGMPICFIIRSLEFLSGNGGSSEESEVVVVEARVGSEEDVHESGRRRRTTKHGWTRRHAMLWERDTEQAKHSNHHPSPIDL